MFRAVWQSFWGDLDTPSAFRDDPAGTAAQVVRLHPDMDAFRVQFGASEAELDDLFRLALQIERGA
jgi:hypothetical protein